ncbi:MAG: methionine--tRNA ligase [Candidatus Rokubacteria bacterium GWC2_70_24]|nr:MAG: methionine--tRNA ligase [Candidatus Rokubacteria bacterium GWA2_70_23]OGK92399.1 MAG: methionine--tRNA ligase [Candidatus Rokubacteria bacterium GWC2_70_24]
MTRRTFYLTTPIFYVNARPHLGHACTTIMADAMCRYRRLRGDRVYFLTGTDEHGDKIAQAAAQAGVSPQAYADEIAAAFRATWRRLGITNDDFIRTTEARHKQVVQRILQTLHDAGEIYFGEYGGNYCFGCERFYTDKEIVGGKCPDHQTPLTFIKEKNYFFRMSKYQEWLITHIEEHPDFIQPERYRNEVLGFLREPLQDLSISRPRSRLQWGIPLPFDDGYVTYVWFDALINYASALGFPDGDLYRDLWPHCEHLIGKDILKPHGVYWPSMLKAAGIPIYQRLHVHGYWSLGGGKMSKSVGNVVEAFQLTDKYGYDAFRYFLLREMNFGLDASFSEEALVGRLNADLANDLGNLASRATTLIVNFGRGHVPAPGPEGAEEASVRETLERVRREVDEAMKEFAFQRALSAIWEFVGRVNRYVDSAAPWALAKDDSHAERLRTVLYTLGESLRCLGIVLDPFLPEAAGKIRAAVGTGAPSLADLEWGRLAPGTPVQKAPGLFPRIEVKVSETSQAAGQSSASRITLDDFKKVDLRVAEVVAAEKVARSKKLLKLTVTVGEETRTLVAGIAEHYAPEALVGRKVIVVANLEPATLMGIESNGMVLAGSTEGTVSLLMPDKDLPPGSRVK